MENNQPGRISSSRGHSMNHSSGMNLTTSLVRPGTYLRTRSSHCRRRLIARLRTVGVAVSDGYGLIRCGNMQWLQLTHAVQDNQERSCRCPWAKCRIRGMRCYRARSGCDYAAACWWHQPDAASMDSAGVVENVRPRKHKLRRVLARRDLADMGAPGEG
jgi:hypothetical protein